MHDHPSQFLGPYELLHLTERRRGYEDWLAVCGTNRRQLHRVETAATIEPCAGRVHRQRSLSHANVL